METTTKRRRSTFAILFFLNKEKMKKNGLCPVICRITVDGKATKFNTKIDADPEHWESKAGKASGKTTASADVNRAVERVNAEIIQYYKEILDTRGYVTSELIKNRITGIGGKSEMLLALFAEHNTEYKRRIGIDRKPGSYETYMQTYRKLSDFILQKFENEDIPLKQLTICFIEDFDKYLRIERRDSESTAATNTILLKKITRRAVSEGTLRCDPFANFKPVTPPKKCRHLKAEQIDRLMQTQIDNPRVRHTRDMFVFACFTGISFADLRTLSVEHIVRTDNGSLWIHKKREKTGTEFNVRLLNIPLEIMEKYKPERKTDKIFNTTCKVNVFYHLRELEKLCDIDHITFHMARHNFATHITLSKGVPMATVSKMMGHRSIRTTQIYAKITGQKVNEDMKKLSERIAGKYSLPDMNAIILANSPIESQVRT